MDLVIETLSKDHNKKKFHCGSDILDNYIKKHAKQDIKRDLSACYVLVNSDNKLVIGYYTLSAYSIRREDFPENIAKKLPPAYQSLPTALMGRLAIDKEFQGQGYGQLILVDALNRCVDISHSIGTLAVVVDPIDKSAEDFYRRYGFILLPGTGRMFIPIKTIEDSL